MDKSGNKTVYLSKGGQGSKSSNPQGDKTLMESTIMFGEDDDYEDNPIIQNVVENYAGTGLLSKHGKRRSDLISHMGKHTVATNLRKESALSTRLSKSFTAGLAEQDKRLFSAFDFGRPLPKEKWVNHPISSIASKPPQRRKTRSQKQEEPNKKTRHIRFI